MTTCGSPAVTTLEDAEAPYYTVFAKSAHASDFDGMLEMSMISCTAEWVTAEPIFLMYRLR